jgi:hypothetical protein
LQPHSMFLRSVAWSSFQNFTPAHGAALRVEFFLSPVDNRMHD